MSLARSLMAESNYCRIPTFTFCHKKSNSRHRLPPLMSIPSDTSSRLVDFHPVAFWTLVAFGIWALVVVFYGALVSSRLCRPRNTDASEEVDLGSTSGERQKELEKVLTQQSRVVQKTDIIDSNCDTNSDSTSTQIDSQDLVDSLNETDLESGLSSSSLDEGDFPGGALVLPNQRKVDNFCAVCLATYKEGDRMVWSSQCGHHFHERCIFDWIAKQKKGAPCPCCRQEFIDVDESTSEVYRC